MKLTRAILSEFANGESYIYAVAKKLGHSRHNTGIMVRRFTERGWLRMTRLDHPTRGQNYRVYLALTDKGRAKLEETHVDP